MPTIKRKPQTVFSFKKGVKETAEQQISNIKRSDDIEVLKIGKNNDGTEFIIIKIDGIKT